MCPAACQTQTTVPHPNCSIRVQPPWNPMHLYLLPRRTACSVSIYLPALHVAALFTTCIPLSALTPLSCRPFLNSLSKLRTCAVITRYLSPLSRSLLHVIHISTIDTTRIQSLCTIFPGSYRLFSVTLSCLDFRCPLGYLSHIHPSASCRNIHMSFTCIPYIVSSLDLHSKKAPALYS